MTRWQNRHGLIHKWSESPVLDLNDVALFVQIVRSGSFAGAARRLGVPANTLSRRVQRLETALGTRLLQRSTRKLALTEPGQAFFDRCAGAVDGLGDAGEELMSGSREPSGLVRVAAAADFFDFFRMEWLAEFLATYPKVRVEFVLSDARADLIADRIDLAIRGGGLEDSGFIARPVIAPGRGGLVASPGYLAARGTPRRLAHLAKHDCVLPPHPGGRRTWQLAGPGGAVESVEVSGRFTANTARALRKATVAGLGIALLPPAVTRQDLREGRLIPVLPDYYRASNGLNVLYPSRHQLPLATVAFRELIVAKLGSLEATWPQA